MKIFVLLSNAPHSGGEAIEVVGHEVVEKAQQLGHSVCLQVIFRDPRGSKAAQQAEQTLREVKLPGVVAVSYTHLRAHETVLDIVCRLLLEKKKSEKKTKKNYSCHKK